MAPIRVVLAENHTLVRKGLDALLADEPDIQVVGEAQDGREALRQVEALRPDVVLMDISMPGLNGLEATRQIVRRYAGVRVLMLTMHADEAYILEALKAGASGYLLKEAAPEELVLAIGAVARGESFLSPPISRTVITQYLRHDLSAPDESLERLTEREREVLQLVAEGHNNREIAALLSLSVKTVENHRAHLMDKLDIHTVAGLTQYAIRHRLIELKS
jgi:DNA-binding NarL/FixJ family response regulator